MARSHTMTPARRAALRKAQLASARKRRKGGVGTAAKKAVRQRAGYTAASFRLQQRKALPGKGKKGRSRKALKYTAVGLGTAAAVYGGYKHAELGAATKRARSYSGGTYEPRRRDILRNRHTYRRDERRFKRIAKREIRTMTRGR